MSRSARLRRPRAGPGRAPPRAAPGRRSAPPGAAQALRTFLRHDEGNVGRHAGAEKAELLLEAARYLNETLELERVYDRFHELLADAVPHGGVIVSSFDPQTELIHCDYALVDGEKLDPQILPPLELNREGGGMQSRVIVGGQPLVVNDVPEQVKKPGGTYYDVDKEGQLRKVPEEGPPGVQSAMMLPVKYEGEVVGVVQLMHEHFRYEPEHRELAEGLVGLMAAAVRNARLHKQAQAEAAARARAEATAAEREHAARVLEAVGDGTFLLDDDSIVRLWNRAAELVTGRDRDSVLGQPVMDVFASWDALAREIPVSAGWAPARSVTLPVELEGRELWLSFLAVRSLAGIVYAFRDLTIERRLEEAKSDFVASISHELRTPMTAVLGAANTLLREDIELSPERRRQLLEMIGSQGKRLTQMTEDVLLAGRLDHGDLRLEREPVDLAELVRTAVETMREQLPESVTLRIVPDGAVKAVGDPDRIEQVLLNLIDNAVKYSPRGGEVTIATLPAEGRARVEVADEGLGIPPAEHGSVFEKFYRSRSVQVPTGTGLGLYICRELVRRMGGTIGVRSRPGAGSTFYFELPSDT
ncbi:MAG: GAF domain-containing sensor histidine kinase [Actinobacteria bacterium]|nr:MAG: GAF domain-containing sensor histidine kinase [Actinomycetota bacterium]